MTNTTNLSGDFPVSMRTCTGTLEQLHKIIRTGSRHRLQIMQK